MVKKEYVAPCGRLLLCVQGQSLCLCDWMVSGRIEKTMRRIRRQLPSTLADDASLLIKVEKQLDEYFAGTRHEFNLPLMPLGSDFQREVWDALLHIEYGETASYSSIAKAIGRPESVRAVANAIGANPISIIIPCHRVVGSDGSLTGYAGGLKAKSYFLELERNN